MSLVFVLGTMASMGLSLTMQEITGPLRNTRFVVVALAANFVVLPILAFIFIRVFSLDEPLAVGLLLVSLAVALFVRARYPETTASALPSFTQASNLSLLFLLVLMVVLNFSDVVGLLGTGGLLASLVLVVLTTAGGVAAGQTGPGR